MFKWVCNLLKTNKEELIDNVVYDPYHIQRPHHPVAYKTKK